MGSELIKLLVSSGGNVKAFDLPSANWEKIEGIGCVEDVFGDINDLNLISEACKDVDIVIRLAALLPPKSEVEK